MSLTREQILNADDSKLVEVNVPEWGGSVFIRVLTAGNREKWEQVAIKASDNKEYDIRASLVCLTVCDEKGNQLFTPEDIDELKKKSCVPILRLFDKATELNNVTKQDIEELGNE